MTDNLPAALLGDALAHGGATITAEGHDYRDGGYAVGGAAPALIMPDTESVRAMLADAGSWLAAHPVPVYGSWRTPEGSIELDAVTILHNLTQACHLAAKRHQRAIFDFVRGVDINV